MTEQQHPITPPPELVERLRNDAPRGIRDAGVTRERHLVIAAYRAGADRELDACCEWVRSSVFIDLDGHDALRAARRPEPQNLAEQALALINHDPDDQPFLSKRVLPSCVALLSVCRSWRKAMAEQQHPITPPQELMEQWRGRWIEDAAEGNTQDLGITPSFMVYIATQAARWGADQELWACCELLDINGCPSKWIDMLRAARRPKPPSLAEQALEEIQQMEGAMYSADLGCDFTATRAALERLQQLEQENND